MEPIDSYRRPQARRSYKMLFKVTKIVKHTKNGNMKTLDWAVDILLKGIALGFIAVIAYKIWQYFN